MRLLLPEKHPTTRWSHSGAGLGPLDHTVKGRPEISSRAAGKAQVFSNRKITRIPGTREKQAENRAPTNAKTHAREQTCSFLKSAFL